MSRYYKWFALIAVIGTLISIRFGTEIITKQYQPGSPTAGEMNLSGKVNSDGEFEGDAVFKFDSPVKKTTPFSFQGKIEANRSSAKAGGHIELSTFHYGLWSILPAIVTLVLAFSTRQVILALFAGIVTGGIIGGNIDIVSGYILPALGTPGYAQILLIYLWSLGGLIGIWRKTGGAQRFSSWAASTIVRGRRSAKFFAYIMGLIFHQGGTISTVLAGTTVKPVADEEKISHEELSYIIDSTASPVATLIPFNVWPSYTGALIIGTTSFLTNMDEAIAFYFASIPFNFYAIMALIFTLSTSLEIMPWYGKRMRRAMDRSRETGKLDADGAEPMTSKELSITSIPESYRPHAIDFIIPLGTLICLAGIPIFLVGRPMVDQAFFLALLVAMLLASLRGMKIKDILEGFIDGVKGVTIGAIILGLAITLGKVSGALGTANYIVSNLGSIIPALVLPASFLGICMLISFSTGTSLGTYAVVLPIAMPLALEVASQAGLSNPHLFLTLCFSAVVGGAVYGDNCSPISDTTILSSVATGCDLMDHVYTQLPLATLAAGVAALLYTACTLLTF